MPDQTVPIYRCRWAKDEYGTCSLEFPAMDALRDHIVEQHTNTQPAIPTVCLETWQSLNGQWRGKLKPDAIKQYTDSLKVDASISNQLTETDNSPDESRDVSMTSRVPRPASHPLEAHGISRSQESAVVTQMFSTYITSSDEQRLQQQYNSSNPAGNTPASNPSQTHARNASNESASLPQSHDYETVQGILPHDIPPLHTSPGQPGPQEYASPTISNRSVKATTPLQVGIAFGTLPNVSSSSGTSASSSNPFAGLSDHGDTPTAVGPIDSPSSSKKNVDKPLRFGFGGK